MEAIGSRTRCTICPHNCNLAEGQKGACGNRINRNGSIVSSVYGHPCAINIDPIEKKPLLHFHPGWKCFSLACEGCNFSCINCQNWEISQNIKSSSSGQNENFISPEEIVAACKREKIPAIAYTYTEPITWFEYTCDIASLAAENGIKNILVSAGYINKEPLKKLCSVTDAANIDLKSFSDKLYRSVSGGGLAPVLNTLLAIKEAGKWLEITNLVIPGINDDTSMIKEMCKWLVNNGLESCPLHFSRFFPMYRMQNVSPTPIGILIEARNIALDAGMKFVYTGNVAEQEGAHFEDTVCPSCGRTLVERSGWRIIRNKIAEAGKCPFCGETIPGFW